jgi:hypothetical protein
LTGFPPLQRADSPTFERSGAEELARVYQAGGGDSGSPASGEEGDPVV